jgi:hypothetical protein
MSMTKVRIVCATMFPRVVGIDSDAECRAFHALTRDDEAMRFETEVDEETLDTSIDAILAQNNVPADLRQYYRVFRLSDKVELLRKS